LFPHGAGCIVDAELATAPGTGMSLDDVCDSAMRLRWQASTWLSPAGNSQLVELDDLAHQSLVRSLQKLTGRRRVANVESPHEGPISVATIISGTPSSPAFDAELQRRAQALTQWKQAWKRVTLLAELSRLLRPIEGEGEDDVIFVTDTGRFVWGPSLMEMPAVVPPTPPSQLADLHRSLMWMSLQVDSLGALTQELARGDRDEASPTLLSFQRQVALLMGRLYAGKGTIRLPSIKDQIQDHGYVETANVLRFIEQEPPLVATQ
jgi:hypothetical protein